MKELDALRKELAKLKSEKTAFQVQSKLLENFVTMAQSSGKEKMLARILQVTLEVSTEMTAAEKGSLFLLDREGVVTESILTRGDTTPDERSRLIGKVLDKGLAGWVIRHRKVGLIPDTSTDDRWLDLPDQPYTVRSALSVPIMRGKELRGLITLLHSQSDHFSAESADMMLITARHIGVALENARLYSKLDQSYRSLETAKAKIEAYSKALDAELDKGKKIQKDFLPNQIPQLPGWEIATCFHPARQVSGDFYDAFLLPGSRVGLVIADVCDKGVGSALFMALFRSLIRVFSGQTSLQGWSAAGSDEVKPATSDFDLNRSLQAVKLTNDYIAEEHGEEGMFATLFFGVLDSATGVIAFVNAGHEPLLVVGPSGVKSKLLPAGPAVGLFPWAEFKIKQVQLDPGDILIGFTDGVTEALSPQETAYSRQRFLSLISKPASSATELIDRIKTDLDSHIDNAPQFDDITMIAVYREPL